MKHFFVLLFVISIPIIAFCQQVTGVIKAKGIAVAGCTVENSTKKVYTTTDSKGMFTIKADKGDLLKFSMVGFNSMEIAIGSTTKLLFELEESADIGEVVVVGTRSISMRNFWVGAKVGYNFIDNDDVNGFIGSASIAINLLDNSNAGHHFGVVGNIGNFRFNQDEEDNKNVQKLAQSANGLNVGLAYTHESLKTGATEFKTIKEKPKSFFRQTIATGIRLNSFKNVGKDSITVNFPQFVTSAGLEYEQTGFKNGGSMTFSAGSSIFLFDKNLYNQILNQTKSSLFIFEFNAILPLSKNMGFYVNGTFTPKVAAVYTLGVIIKS